MKDIDDADLQADRSPRSPAAASLELHPTETPPARPWPAAMAQGAARRCPACGEGEMFRGFLKVRDQCAVCSEELHHHRADDLPAFICVLIGGKLAVALMVLGEDLAPMGDWGMLFYPLIAVAAVLALLSPVKGAVVGLQWALRMHGFEAPSRSTALPIDLARGVKPGHEGPYEP